jgi:hypothetical protein
MVDLSTIGAFLLGGGGLVGSSIAIYMARANKTKIGAETKKLDTEAAKLDDDRFQTRELFWQREVQKVKDELNPKIEDLEREVASLKLLIEGHIPWDWEVLRKLRLNGIEQRDPPTLIWIEEQRSQT